jgi:predicted metal-dependent hydrolase
MLKSSESEVIIDGKIYKVKIDRKAFQRNSYIRLKDDVFYISTNLTATDSFVSNFLDKYAVTLIKRNQKYKKVLIKENGMYIFGEFVNFEEGFIKVLNHNILYSTPEDFYKKVNKIVKPYFDERLKYFEEIMNVMPLYNLKLRKSTTRYGCNIKKTYTITFNLELIHYDPEIIDSVIIHELAHHFEFNHQKNFYKIVYKYCPNYDDLDRKLKRGIVK